MGLIKTLAAAGADVKWVEAKNLHFTMKFLDEVALNKSRISAAVARAAATIEPFDLEVRGAGLPMLPGRRPSGGAGVGEGNDDRVACRLGGRVSKFGFRKEHRRFTPHLTLGRVRSSGPAVEALGRVPVEIAS